MYIVSEKSFLPVPSTGTPRNDHESVSGLYTDSGVISTTGGDDYYISNYALYQCLKMKTNTRLSNFKFGVQSNLDYLDLSGPR